MKGFRSVLPGEVDHEIDRAQLFQPPSPEWDTKTCDAIYERYVAPGTGCLIPDEVFCDLPKADFLDYASCQHSVLLMGSRFGDLRRLEPIVLSQNLIGWNKPRYIAFRNSTEAIFLAVLDVDKIVQLGYPTRTTLVMPEGFYFGLDYRVVSEGPWRSGTVYLYRGSDFPEDLHSRPFMTDTTIRPLARVKVFPSDWSMIHQVQGADVKAQIERQWESFRGYPWRDDDAIHPGQWKRPLAEAMKSLLDVKVGEPVGLTELGKIAGVGSTAALRIFRAVMGQSPRDYSLGVRIHEARRLLRKGLPIAEVAAETGFCDQTHMTRHFLRLVGMTPGRYLRAQESPIHRA